MSFELFGAVVFVCVTILVGLAMVLHHLASMRVTTSEVAELRQQWTAGSLGIAQSQAALDKKLIDLSDAVTHLRNRLGNAGK